MSLRYRLAHPIETVRKLETFAAELRDLPAATKELRDAVVQMGGLPLPPPHLQRRVGKVYNGRWVEHGESLLREIQAFIAPVPVSGAVLDWGCGPGRLIRAMHYRTDAQLAGCDIDAEAISWCQANLPGEFHVNDVLPPLPFTDDRFDVVIGLSVFTHLPGEHQRPWLEELRRVLKPGGHAFLSFHGAPHHGRIPGELRATFTREGFVYWGSHATEGLPEHYQLTVHSEEYIAREWGEVVRVVKVEDMVIDDFQGGVLVQPGY